jgi:hypothetical protein
MPREILRIADTMIRKPLLPNLAAANFDAHSVGISSFDQLHCAFQRNIRSRRQEQMNVIGHHDECVQLESSLPAIAVKGFQEKPRVRLDDKQSPSLESREVHKISSGRRNPSGGSHRAKPQRLKPLARQPNRCDWKSHPSRVEIFHRNPFLGILAYSTAAKLIACASHNREGRDFQSRPTPTRAGRHYPPRRLSTHEVAALAAEGHASRSFPQRIVTNNLY